MTSHENLSIAHRFNNVHFFHSYQFTRSFPNSFHQVKDIYDIVDEECLGDFPWWILILILLLLLLFLLLWCLWCCMPRCCNGPCLRKCPGCASCCTKGGKYSSTRTDAEDIGSDTDEDELLSRPIPPNGPDDQPDGRPIPMGDDPDPGPDPEGFNLPPSYRTGTDGKDDIDHGDPRFETRSGYIDGGPAGRSDFHTESWTDTRVPGGVLGRNTGGDYSTTRTVGRQDFGDESYYYNRSGGTDRHFVDSYHNRTGGNVVPYILPGPRTNYIRTTNSRHYPARAGSRSSRVVRVRNGGIRKRTSDYKIRRGDYREYIDRRRADQDYEMGGMYLTENDLNEMARIRKMRGRTTSGYRYGYAPPKERYVMHTDSRLADALVDRSYIRKNRHHDYDNRRYSTGSLLRSENAAEIDPRNLRLRIEDNRYDSRWSPYYSTDSYYSSGTPASARAYFEDRNYFRNRYEVDGSRVSSADDYIVDSHYPTTTRKINLYRKRYNGGDSISDGAHSVASRRRVFYTTNSNASHAGDGGVRTRFRTSNSGTRRANTTTTRSYHNRAYDYGESSV